MSYVDALYEKDKDLVHVVERDKNGSRIFKTYPAIYQFYYEDPKGKHRSIYDEPITRVRCANHKEFKKEISINSHKKLYETDLNLTFTVLSEYYLNQDAPKLNIAFFDIETDMHPELGFSSPEDALMPITAISVYLQWIDTLITVAIPPKTLTIEQARELVADIPNVVLFEKESEMLDYFLSIIEDSDVISGWNSTGYDIPFTVRRIAKVLSKNDLKRLCLWNKEPKKREYEKYGKTSSTFDLFGRVHLDYLELYQKFTFEERQSFRLDYIGQFEVNERKTEYEGTLDQLYNKDFRKFIIYNRQDTALLNKIDQKLKFIDLGNVMAHENAILLPTIMGTVIPTEQALINEAHALGLRIPTRKRSNSDNENTQAAGAYVAYPKKGLHEWVGSFDINSLYPSAIRALNMSPETIVGQLRQTDTHAYITNKMENEKASFAHAWEGLFGSLEYEAVMNQDKTYLITVDWESGESEEYSAAQIYKMIFDSNNPLILTANGTIFSYNKTGLIPDVLAKWYATRKQMQQTMRGFKDLSYGIEIPERLL